MRPRRMFRFIVIGLAVAAALRARRAVAPGREGVARLAATAPAGAGMAAVRDEPLDPVSQASEESFPASDSPGWIRMRS